ncbi:hypothetical protein AOQ84DRAFT_443746 [Glonium stellatum]|uniref:Tafazzin n=1 Tax=Glonium stellatum TaxID=574774 RepID=A0A8E2EN99_9PEZI|nr:hypothetical protein AOQ84DRAFT_443746 [Glonium stellatum]
MPKKHQPIFSKPSSTYVHPSLESSRASPTTPSTPRTVNDRINQLRREQAPRRSLERWNEITDVVTKRTVPPGLRHILNIPEVDPPLPKPGLRRAGLSRTRPPPSGPAAPISWLHQSRHVPSQIRELNERPALLGQSGYIPVKFSLLATLGDGSKRLPPKRSLVHHTLKILATNWEWLVEYEQYYLATLPIPLKEALLSYISAYGPDDCLSLKSFRLLLLDGNELDGGTGSDELEQLDLSGLLNEKFTLTDLTKHITRPRSISLAEALDSLDVSEAKGKKKATAEVVESWEDEVDISTPSMSKPLGISSFPYITRLSLANPGPWASWAQLLSLSTHLKTLTHLSLAYWPTPSSTPNATAASMVSKHTRPVSLGGTSLYSALDNDWHEAANILRRLSNNTYCLKWLDLEGCTWHQALTWGVPPMSQWLKNERPDEHSTPSTSSYPFLGPNLDNPQSHDSDDWVEHHAAPGPDWNGSWRQVEYINVSQGWVPHDVPAIRGMPAGLIACELLGYLRGLQESGDLPENKSRPLGDHYLRLWMEREKEARKVESMVRALRSSAKGVYCKFDHGWSPPIVVSGPAE